MYWTEYGWLRIESSPTPENIISIYIYIYVQYLSVSVEMLEDTTETKDALSLTSPPENMQLSLVSFFSQ